MSSMSHKRSCCCHSPFVHSVPFFFEPNFDATIEPLPAALRIQEGGPTKGKTNGDAKQYPPIVYGEFLKRKVGNNFAGGSRYD